jgi:beta-galactosidase
MVHGGTTFGFNAGANCPPFSPQSTSYDYDAPINENGEATTKYFALRDLFSKYLLPGETLPDPPSPHTIIAIPKIELTPYASVKDNLGKPTHVVDPQPMELFDQGSGCILYRTTLTQGPVCTLSIKQVHDYAIIMLDGKRIGVLDRRKKNSPLTIPARSKSSTLDILIEAMGRVNYGEYLHDRKGITQSVEIVNDNTRHPLKEWDVYSIPLTDQYISNLTSSTNNEGPCFYYGSFDLEKTGDSFLDLQQWNKGVAWVNGYNLGRYWNIGPQQTLYLPAPWLKTGRNEIMIFDLGENVEHPFVEGRATPILDDVREALPRPHSQSGQRINLDGITPVSAGSFIQGSQPQSIIFQPVTARYICFESLNSQAADSFASCAELNLIGPNKKLLSRAHWKIVYASSEELESEDGSADNVLDDDTETIWHTEWGNAQPSHPHQIVIDLGKDEIFSSLEYTPRPGGNRPGRIKDYKIYVSTKPFPDL